MTDRYERIRYRANGYNDREDYGIDLDTVYALADLLEPNEYVNVSEQGILAWARPVWARPVNAPEPAEEWDELVDIEFHTRPEKPEGEGWRPLIVADAVPALQAEIKALRAEVSELRAALAKAETQKCPSDVNDTTRGS